MVWKLNPVMDAAGPGRGTGLSVKRFLLKTAEICMIRADARCPSWTFDTLLELNALNKLISSS